MLEHQALVDNPLSPEPNRQVERLNGTIVARLWHYIAEIKLTGSSMYGY